MIQIIWSWKDMLTLYFSYHIVCYAVHIKVLACKSV